jgi:hypothetical protein
MFRKPNRRPIQEFRAGRRLVLSHFVLYVFSKSATETRLNCENQLEIEKIMISRNLESYESTILENQSGAILYLIFIPFFDT